jgi:hypothetical protein
MNKRDRSRQWQVVYEDGFSFDGQDVCYGCQSGLNKNKGSRLNEVTIGDWLDIELIKGKTNKSKETYRVRFNGTEYVVRIDSKGNPVVKLRWADSFVNANPTNIGQLMDSTANAKRKRS